MDARFCFAVDWHRDLVRITMSGLFGEADIARFLEARRAAHAQLGCAPNQHFTLNDVRAMKIQPQQSVAAFQELLADPAYRSRRLAFLVSPTLATSQLKRAAADRQVRCFEDQGEAEAWLFEDGAEEEREAIARWRPRLVA